MSRNSKGYRITKLRASKDRGPAQTTPKHGKKVRAWANRPGRTRPSLTYTPGKGWAQVSA